MAFTLVKKENIGSTPLPRYSDTLQDQNKEEIRCAACNEIYIFGYSNGEKYRAEKLRAEAQDRVDNSHADGHPAHLYRKAAGASDEVLFNDIASQSYP